MSAAVLKFKDLGIKEFVKDLELTELGNHIAAKLREMTGKKRKNVDGRPFWNAPISTFRNTHIPGSVEPIQSSRKSPRLTPSSRVSHTSIFNFANRPITNHGFFGYPCHSLMPNLAQEHSGSQGPQDENTSGSIVDDFMVPFDPFSGC